MLREECDDVLELCATSAYTSAYTVYGTKPWLMTYGHLAVIDRVEMLKRIDSGRLTPHHQRQITSFHTIGLLTMADGS